MVRAETPSELCQEPDTARGPARSLAALLVGQVLGVIVRHVRWVEYLQSKVYHPPQIRPVKQHKEPLDARHLGPRRIVRLS